MKNTITMFIFLSIPSLQLYSQEQKETNSVHREMMQEMVSYHLAQHVIAHFDKETLYTFLDNAEKKTGQDFETFDKNLEQAGINFLKSQSFPTISPVGKTLEEYFEDLKNSK